MRRRVALLTISDRPDLLEATLESFRQAGGLEHVGLVVCVTDNDHRLGFAGAIREGWRQLREHAETIDYVFHLEDDWRFDRPVPIARMAELLDAHTELAQVALLRGKVPGEQLELVETWPAEYRQRWHGTTGCEPLLYLEHDLYWTTNPCLYRMRTVKLRDWPPAPNSERAFTDQLRRDLLVFAALGEGEPWVTHTGDDRREGKGY